MRISSASAFEGTVANLQRRQQALTEAQQQLTSGKRVQKASDDPAAAATAERALAAMARSESRQRALDAAKTAMQLGESALGDAGELLHQAREAVVGAGNGSYTDADRKTLADKLSGLRSDLLGVANRQDGTGRYLFGGQGIDSQPILETPSGITYTGTPGEQQAASGESMSMSIDGRAVWLHAPDPNNPAVPVSILDALERTITELSTTGRTPAQVSQTVKQGLSDIDAAAGNLSSWRAKAGQALNRADGIASRLSQTKLDAQTERSNAEDLDMVQAISDFQNKQTGYDAALKTYSMVQRMSLFDYLK